MITLKRNFLSIFVLSIAYFLPMVPFAIANDTTSELAAGGLVFKKSDQIKMKSEILTISPNRIIVDYVFENESSEDVETLVAFPMPDLNFGFLYNRPTDIPSLNTPNILNFETYVDRMRIFPNREVRSFLDGADITDILKSLDVSIFSENTEKYGAIHLNKKQLGPLMDMGAIIPNYGDDKEKIMSGDENYGAFGAAWTSIIKYYWTQKFPAHKNISIKHQYQPAKGGFYFYTDGPYVQKKFHTNVDSVIEIGNGNGDRDDWCRDDKFFERSDKNEQIFFGDNNGPYLIGDWVKYILKTGANWNGPIESFELRLEKDDYDLISTCPIQGLKLVETPAGFSAKASNFTPTEDLNILFVYGKTRWQRNQWKN